MGTEISPFVLLLDAPNRDCSGALVAVDDAGAVRVLAEVSAREVNVTGSARLVGTSRDGGEVLVVGRLQAPGAGGSGKPPYALWKVRAAGGLEKVPTSRRKRPRSRAG